MRIRLDIPLSLSEVCTAVDGKLTGADATVSFVCTDSRKVECGDLFIAITGTRYNGNDFAHEVRSKGAYVIGQRDASIFVTSTEAAMLKIVSLSKSKLPFLKHTVAITGSIGKTTTKELSKKILSTKYKVHANHENFNNSIGLFHTVLSADKQTEVLIIEMGMNHMGEISQLSQAVTPDVAIITNIGTAHIGNLGSREAIAEAKLEIRDGMTGGVHIIPYGEPLLSLGRTVSVDQSNGYYNLHLHNVDQNESIFSFYGGTIVLNEERVALVGAHLMTALAFAISIAEVCKLNENDIRRGISQIDQSCLRQKRMQVGKYDVYDDTYSSSPEAAAATIKALAQQFPGSVSAVLGDMLELGEHSAPLHSKLGKIAAECGIRRLYLFGSFSEHVKTGALSAGMDEDCIFTNTDGDIELTANNIRESYNGELLIVKASHNVHAERLFDFLKD